MNVQVQIVIDSEREYQKRKWGDPPHTVTEWILILDKLNADVKQAWFTEGDAAALKEIRQLTAVGVACMEQHPTATR